MGCYSENDLKIPKITHTASRTGSHICQLQICNSSFQSRLNEH